MLLNLLREAERVAAARWQASEHQPDARAQRRASLLAQIDEIAARCWAQKEQPTPPPPPGGTLPATPYRLYDSAGHQLCCTYCGHGDRWRLAADGQLRLRLFVCEHAPAQVGDDLMQHITTISLSRVARCEAVDPNA